MKNKQCLSFAAVALMSVIPLADLRLAAGSTPPTTTPIVKPKPKVQKHPASYSSIGWRPEPALRGRLAALDQFENYSIQPPRGYAETIRTRGSETFYYWTGFAHDNGVVPELLIGTNVELTDAPLDNQTLYTKEIAKIKLQYPDVIFSPMETGTLNGLSFLRTYYRGNDQREFMHHGVVYITVDGTEVYTVTGDDTDPYSTNTLPLLEAAARTFQKARS